MFVDHIHPSCTVHVIEIKSKKSLSQSRQSHWSHRSRRIRFLGLRFQVGKNPISLSKVVCNPKPKKEPFYNGPTMTEKQTNELHIQLCQKITDLFIVKGPSTIFGKSLVQISV